MKEEDDVDEIQRMRYVSEQPNPLEQNACLRALAWLLVPVLLLLTCCTIAAVC